MQCAGAEAELDVEVEALAAVDAVPQQARRTARIEGRFERLHQVAVLAPQVEEALPGTDRPGGQGHALEHGIGLPVQQNPVLEGAGLSLVGVANHHTCVARGQRCVAAQRPLAGGGESCAAAPATTITRSASRRTRPTNPASCAGACAIAASRRRGLTDRRRGSKRGRRADTRP